jgi:3-deoxy-D-manno-octulosonic-acid transferase
MKNLKFTYKGIFFLTYLLFESFKMVCFLLSPFVARLRRRKAFENQNQIFQESCDYTFEYSSEGELEQSMQLILKALHQNKKVQLLYSSESVEERSQELYQTFKEKIILTRIPFITGHFFSKMHIKNHIYGKKVIFCRYDFFPDLIFYCLSKKKEMNLIWATNKKYGQKFSTYHKIVYKLFSKIIAATQRDRALLSTVIHSSCKTLVYDFRPRQIQQRLLNSNKRLESKLQDFKAFLETLEKFPKSKRIIMGSAYPEEISEDGLDIIDQLIVILPHKLHPSSISKLAKNLKNYQDHPVVILNATDSKESYLRKLKQIDSSPAILIMNYKGILLELYQFFQYAYVGGGLFKSVHSLLEPAVSGCRVYCGQYIHRSTEADLIKEANPLQLFIVSSVSEALTNSYNSGNLNIDINFQNYIYQYEKAVGFILDE